MSMYDEIAICDNTGQPFDLSKVTVTKRYSDCSIFKCPRCRKEHDDRMRFSARNRNQKNGYTVVDPDDPFAHF